MLLMETATQDFTFGGTKPSCSWADICDDNDDAKPAEQKEYRDDSMRTKRPWEDMSSLLTDDGFNDHHPIKRQALPTDPRFQNISYECGVPAEIEQSLANSVMSLGSTISQQTAPADSPSNAVATPDLGFAAVPQIAAVPLVPVYPVMCIPVFPATAVQPIAPPSPEMAAGPVKEEVDIKPEVLEKRYKEIQMIKEDFPEAVVAETPMGRASDPRMTKRPWEEVKAQYRLALKVTQLRHMAIGSDDLSKLALTLVHRERVHAREHVKEAAEYLPRLERLVKSIVAQGFTEEQVLAEVKTSYSPGIKEADHIAAALKALRA